MHQDLDNFVNLASAPLADAAFRARCKQALDDYGALELPQFLQPSAMATIQKEGKAQQHLAYYSANQNNICLSKSDPAFTPNHPCNRLVPSSKGHITDDQVPANSVMRTQYDALLIEKPTGGGEFEFVKGMRGLVSDEKNRQVIQRVLDGEAPVQKLAMEAGTPVLFRGRTSMHRVTPVAGDRNRNRMRALLAYNNQAGVSLNETAQVIFYGRVA